MTILAALAGDALRNLVVAGAAAIALDWAGRYEDEQRLRLWGWVLVACLAMPLANALVPGWQLALPVPAAATWRRPEQSGHPLPGNEATTPSDRRERPTSGVEYPLNLQRGLSLVAGLTAGASGLEVGYMHYRG
ncbi:MAG: hypothetical protein ACRD1E_04170, partial [Terriglobales bacterium]